jgi:hypothetical protein
MQEPLPAGDDGWAEPGSTWVGAGRGTRSSSPASSSTTQSRWSFQAGVAAAFVTVHGLVQAPRARTGPPSSPTGRGPPAVASEC